MSNSIRTIRALPQNCWKPTGNRRLWETDHGRRWRSFTFAERFAVAVALGREVDEAAAEAQAAEALIVLCRDEDRDTRNWAMYGLGNLGSQDSPAIRAALCAGLNDPDHEIRGEALVGLAKRKVPGTAQAIRAEWERDFISLLSLEAAEELRDPGLLGDLLGLQLDEDWSGENYLRDRLELAISACREAAQ